MNKLTMNKVGVNQDGEIETKFMIPIPWYQFIIMIKNRIIIYRRLIKHLIEGMCRPNTKALVMENI